MTTTFLVGVDGSDGSRRAAAFAAERARKEGAALILAHVVDWSPYEVLTPADLASRSVDAKQEIEAATRDVLEPLAASLGEPAPQLVVRHGHAAETLCELASETGATQVFVGKRGRSKLSSLLFGSVSGGLVQACTVPVTVVP